MVLGSRCGRTSIRMIQTDRCYVQDADASGQMPTLVKAAHLLFVVPSEASGWEQKHSRLRGLGKMTCILRLE